MLDAPDTNLHTCELLRSLLHVHPPQSQPDRPRRHKYHFMPLIAELDNGADNPRQNWPQRLVRLLVHDGAGP